MSDEHKASLAQGREEGRAIRNYLQALEDHRPKRGRRRTPESMTARLESIEAELPTADPLRKLSLIQERNDLRDELAKPTQAVDLKALEQTFVKHAKPYSERKGISYAAWREIGVAPTTLKAAGITR